VALRGSFALGGGGGNYRRQLRFAGDGSGDSRRWRGARERKRSERGGGLGRFDRPRTPTGWFGPARWAGLASGPRLEFN
jgi:hypothetical protein